MLTERDDRHHDLTRGMCRTCRRIVDARILFRDGKVWIRPVCPEHGAREALIAGSVDWYLATVNAPQAADRPRAVSKEIARGCPGDCGLCGWHEKACQFPVFSVTNACNLKCPICFTYNRDDRTYFMPVEEFGRIVDWIVASEGFVDIVNVTGGEPLLHPELFRLLDLCDRKEIGRVTLNTNGLLLAGDEALVRRLAERDVCVNLSFHSFDREATRRIHGRDVLDAKRAALGNLGKHGVRTALVHVPIRGLNDGEIGRFARLVLEEEFILSLTVQTMTYTGEGGGSFRPREHLAIDEVAGAIAASGAPVRLEDFRPLPGTHPLCYAVCYLFREGGRVMPLSRAFTEDEFREVLGTGYLIRPDDRFREILSGRIAALWADPSADPDALEILRLMKRMIGLLYPGGRTLSPAERQRMAEKHVKTICIHAHMDEDTFDLSRIVRCGDLVPSADRTYVPACAYNLFHRMKDDRFWRA